MDGGRVQIERLFNLSWKWSKLKCLDLHLLYHHIPQVEIKTKEERDSFSPWVHSFLMLVLISISIFFVYIYNPLLIQFHLYHQPVEIQNQPRSSSPSWPTLNLLTLLSSSIIAQVGSTLTQAHDLRMKVLRFRIPFGVGVLICNHTVHSHESLLRSYCTYLQLCYPVSNCMKRLDWLKISPSWVDKVDDAQVVFIYLIFTHGSYSWCVMNLMDGVWK